MKAEPISPPGRSRTPSAVVFGVLVTALLALLSSREAARADAPTATHLVPSGAERGAKLDIAVLGAVDPWPPRVWASAPRLRVRPSDTKGVLSIAVEPDAAPGTVWIRLYNDEGASALRPFIVGALEEIVEDDEGATSAEPWFLPASRVTLNGRLRGREDVDSFSVPLVSGETLVASLDANGLLGSPMDGVLQVLSPAGFVLAQQDDDRGLDPRLIFPCPEDGRYTVRVFAFPETPTSSIRLASGDDYIYRLTLTTGAFADHAWPLAAGPRTTRVGILGWNLPPELGSIELPSIATPGDEGREDRDGDRILLSPPGLDNALAVARVGWTSTTEDAARDGERRLSPPISITGRIETAGETDVYTLAARGGERLVIDVRARELGFPLDPVLRLRAPGGKLLAEADDTKESRDPRLVHEAPADGLLQVEVLDRFERGGPRHVYRLDVRPAAPDLALAVDRDRHVLEKGKDLEIAVSVERLHGFSRPVTIEATGLPEGVSCTPAESAPEGETAKKVTLRLTAKEGPWSGTFEIVGRVAGETPIVRRARAPIDGLEERTATLWLTVRRLPGREG